MKHTQIDGGMIIEWDVPIPMDDGLVLRGDVFRPNKSGQFPCLMTYGAYGKNLPIRDGFASLYDKMIKTAPDIAEGSSNKYFSFETPDPERWIPEGYAYVRIDSRGAGRSPGIIENQSPREAQDYYECVEWAAQQDWCSGKIGTIGMSYFATMQWFMAGLRPPHLAAACVWDGYADSYRDSARHGGILSEFQKEWFERQIARVQHGLGSRGYHDPVSGLNAAGDVDLTDEELAANQAVGLYENFVKRPLIDDYYRDRTVKGPEIVVPLLSSGSWGAAGRHLRGNVEGFAAAASKEKFLVLRESGFHTLVNKEGVALQKRFFDYYLKGEGDWATTQPPVEVSVRSVDGTFVKRSAQQWPLETTEWTPFFADAGTSTLETTPPAIDSQVVYEATGDGALFLTPPFESETEITGPASLRIWISSSTVDADLFVVLRLIDPDGNDVHVRGIIDPNIPLAVGWLRASHRKLDAERSLPWRPFHTHDQAEPLIPGEIYQVDVEILPTSIVIPAGWRIGLNVRGRDYTHNLSAGTDTHSAKPLRGSQHWEHPLGTSDRPVEVFANKVTIHTGPNRVAKLLLPIIPARR